MTQEELTEEVINFNSSLTGDQRLKLVEIITEFKKTEFKDLIPGIFLIHYRPIDEVDLKSLIENHKI